MKKVFIQNRRTFITNAATGILLMSGGRVAAADNSSWTSHGIKAVLFDGFALFNPHPVAVLTETLFPGLGQTITDSWRLRQFEYCWIRESAQRYENFEKITEDALDFSVHKAGVELKDSGRKQLLNAYNFMDIWPDVLPTFQLLQNYKIRIGILSNMTRRTLLENINHNQLRGYVEPVISTDQLNCYKPSRKAYQMGLDYLHLKKEQILFVAFAGWDASGSSWFGYPTYWVNRMQAVKEELGGLFLSTQVDLGGIEDLL